MSKTNEAQTISLINSIESLGGSAGYKKNPAAFKRILPTDSQALAKSGEIARQVQKISLSDAHDDLNILKAFAQNNDDKRVRKIALALNNVKIDAKGQAASVKSLLSKLRAEQGENKHNLKMIQGIERLGGSARLQKYFDSVGKAAQTPLAASAHDNSVWHASAATVSISPSFWGDRKYLDVVLDKAYGSGISLNQTGDQSGETFAGTLFYRDMQYIDSNLNRFRIEEVMGKDVSDACILWYLDEEVVASFLIRDSRFTGLRGVFSWSFY